MKWRKLSLPVMVILPNLLFPLWRLQNCLFPGKPNQQILASSPSMWFATLNPNLSFILLPPPEFAFVGNLGIEGNRAFWEVGFTLKAKDNESPEYVVRFLHVRLHTRPEVWNICKLGAGDMESQKGWSTQQPGKAADVRMVQLTLQSWPESFLLSGMFTYLCQKEDNIYYKYKAWKRRHHYRCYRH